MVKENLAVYISEKKGIQDYTALVKKFREAAPNTDKLLPAWLFAFVIDSRNPTNKNGE